MGPAAAIILIADEQLTVLLLLTGLPARLTGCSLEAMADNLRLPGDSVAEPDKKGLDVGRSGSSGRSRGLPGTPGTVSMSPFRVFKVRPRRSVPTGGLAVVMSDVQRGGVAGQQLTSLSTISRGQGLFRAECGKLVGDEGICSCTRGCPPRGRLGLLALVPNVCCAQSRDGVCPLHPARSLLFIRVFQ